jgi:hypothetical protein
MSTGSRLTVMWLCVVAIGCGSGPARSPRGPVAGDPDGDLDRLAGGEDQGPVLMVRNPTADSWDLTVGGAPRGSVAPGSEARILGVARGRQVVVASNARLGLSQHATVEVGASGSVAVVLEAMLTRLRVANPYPDAVAVSVDGKVLGEVPGKAEAVFEGVPAGRRLLVLRSTRGPGAVRLERELPPRGEAFVAVPDIAAPGITPGMPKAPEGQGLVRMRNASRLAVTVLADGVEHGSVAAGGTLDLVLAPGSHKLEVRIEGIEARTEHTVTLIPNQVAEWVWGEDAPAP